MSIFLMIIIESIFIGLYCVMLFYIFNFNIIFFGFIKHFSGYLLGLHQYYCNYKKNMNLNNNNIFIESILESIYFYIFYIFIKKFINNEYHIYFIMGFVTHLLAEFLGIHKYFLDNNCS